MISEDSDTTELPKEDDVEDESDCISFCDMQSGEEDSVGEEAKKCK